MGKLLPHFGNVTYSTSGELSPLLKDPQMMTIGLGTRIFLGGGTGYVVWPGTQFRNDVRSINTVCQLVRPERWLLSVMLAA